MVNRKALLAGMASPFLNCLCTMICSSRLLDFKLHSYMNKMSSKAKIYTKTGDKGETGLIGGSRVPKYHARIEACGALDEVNAYAGVILARFPYFPHRDVIEELQQMLFEIGSTVAYPKATSKLPSAKDVKELEQLIDDMTAGMPPLKHFILPGGSELAAQLHLLRTMLRRAERRVVAAFTSEEIPNPEIMRYLNRLSDYLFTLARAINADLKIEDEVWLPQKRSS